VLATVHEITDKVIGERRTQVLRDLGLRVAEGKTAAAACAMAAETLAGHPKDIPFALLYLLDADGGRAHLAGVAGQISGDERASAAEVDLDGMSPAIWPLAEAIRRRTPVVVRDLERPFDRVPAGPRTNPPPGAVVVTIRSNEPHRLAGLLVTGVSARLKLDDAYLSFFELAASQIATAVANARSYEEERRRAEALAEIDRAKTLFFSNVSHELRTPLTLMLGPIGQLLQNSDLSAEQRQQLEVANRNGHRLLRMVNTLLDFSRLEAGRINANYQPTDLSALTADLASQFRSATERAGLALEVRCAPLPVPVYVDRDMWERIVLNLLSNAFKFTFEGSITVSLKAESNQAVLELRDTGVGIPEDELPKLFERFHRVEGSHGRTQEGTGIGLALVRELVHLHGGTVKAESIPGHGSIFTVTIPLGIAHLPDDRVVATEAPVSPARGAQSFVDEALRWLPDRSNMETPKNAGPDLPSEPCIDGDSERKLRILIADDNADMRDYVSRLLAPRYKVHAVADGKEALTDRKGQPSPVGPSPARARRPTLNSK
jgi:signal transduction histidine kinase